MSPTPGVYSPLHSPGVYDSKLKPIPAISKDLRLLAGVVKFQIYNRPPGVYRVACRPVPSEQMTFRRAAVKRKYGSTT